MPFSVVSNRLRQQLEQERSRLMTERDAIIDEAVAQATADIEKAIANLNSLLDSEPDVEPESAPTNGRKRAIRSTARAPKAAVKAAEKSTARVSQAKAPAKATRGKAVEETPTPKPRRAAKPPVDLPLKRSYKNLTVTEATYKLLESSPDQVFSTDEVIASLFTSLNEEQQAAARKSIGLVLGRGSYQGKIDKVQEDPKLFKFKP